MSNETAIIHHSGIRNGIGTPVREVQKVYHLDSEPVVLLVVGFEGSVEEGTSRRRVIGCFTTLSVVSLHYRLFYHDDHSLVAGSVTDSIIGGGQYVGHPIPLWASYPGPGSPLLRRNRGTVQPTLGTDRRRVVEVFGRTDVDGDGVDTFPFHRCGPFSYRLCGGLTMNEVELYCDVLRARLLSQEGLMRDYSTRVGVILGVGAAMMGAGAVILTFSGTDYVLVSGGVFFVMVVAFLVNAIVGSRIIRADDWRTSPGMAKLAPNLGVHEGDEFIRLTGDAFGEAVDLNQRVLDKKARRLGCAIWSLLVEVVGLVVLAFVSLWLSGQGARLASQCPA